MALMIGIAPIVIILVPQATFSHCFKAIFNIFIFQLSNLTFLEGILLKYRARLEAYRFV
jgi:hypothetical protein